MRARLVRITRLPLLPHLRSLRGALRHPVVELAASAIHWLDAGRDMTSYGDNHQTNDDLRHFDANHGSDGGVRFDGAHVNGGEHVGRLWRVSGARSGARLLRVYGGVSEDLSGDAARCVYRCLPGSHFCDFSSSTPFT